MNRTMNNPIEIEASIVDINSSLPALKKSEVIAYSYKEMANDFKNGKIDISIWEELLKQDFGDKENENDFKRSDTRSCPIDDEDYDVVVTGKSGIENTWAYLKRDGVKRAPLAFVTRLVLYYVRMKLHAQKEEVVPGAVEAMNIDTEVVLGDLKADEASRLIRLNRYLNLLIHTDPESLEKIRKIDDILKEG